MKVTKMIQLLGQEVTSFLVLCSCCLAFGQTLFDLIQTPGGAEMPLASQSLHIPVQQAESAVR